jgi:hypothetical protein
MKILTLVLFSVSLAIVPQNLTASQAHDLWLSRFTGPSKATAVLASVESSDLAAIQQSGLFGKVTSFRENPQKPDNSWELSADTADYSHGSTAKSMLIGFGAGRAHIVIEYKLKDASGKVIWTRTIKTHPSFWSSAVTNLHDPKANRQAQKLLDALEKFMKSH